MYPTNNFRKPPTHMVGNNNIEQCAISMLHDNGQLVGFTALEDYYKANIRPRLHDAADSVNPEPAIMGEVMHLINGTRISGLTTVRRLLHDHCFPNKDIERILSDFNNIAYQLIDKFNMDSNPDSNYLRFTLHKGYLVCMSEVVYTPPSLSLIHI